MAQMHCTAFRHQRRGMRAGPEPPRPAARSSPPTSHAGLLRGRKRLGDETAVNRRRRGPPRSPGPTVRALGLAAAPARSAAPRMARGAVAAQGATVPRSTMAPSACVGIAVGSCGALLAGRCNGGTLLPAAGWRLDAILPPSPVLVQSCVECALRFASWSRLRPRRASSPQPPLPPSCSARSVPVPACALAQARFLVPGSRFLSTLAAHA